jgi:hypothetical protein
MTIPSAAAKRYRNLPKLLALGGIGLLACIRPLPLQAQQNYPGEVQPAPAQSDAQSQAREPQGQGQPEAPLPGQPNQAALPQTLTIPAGTVVRVRVDEWLSSDRNLVGDSFSAVLDQPIVVAGWVVARRGQAQTGRVSAVKKGRVGGTSELGVELPELTLVDGQRVQLQTEMLQTSAGTSHGQDATTIGTTTGVGAVIGAIADGGTGAAIGAGAGVAAGIIGVLVTRGRPTVITPETVLSFRLQAPVTIATANSQFAFQPVTQADYDSRPTMARRPRMAPGPPPYYGYPPYAFGYPYPYPYYYTGPYVGLYGVYGRFGGYRR